MFCKKLVNFALIICICMTATSTLLAEDYDGPVTGNLSVNDTGAEGSVLVANFLPGAETTGLITVNSPGELNLYAGTFNSEFGSDLEGWVELDVESGVVNIHGTQFWVGDDQIAEGVTEIDINTYTAGTYGAYNVKWEDADGNSYNIWAYAEVPINLVWLVEEPENQAPVANAGGPYTGDSVDGGPVAVDLTAAASTDPDGVITEWKWDLDNDGVYETNAKIVNINSFPVGTSTVGLVVVDNDGLQSQPVTTTVTVTKLTPEINVYPAELTHDYGDVEIEVSETYVVQIKNTGQGNLNVSSIALNGSDDFTITDMPDPTNGNIVIAPDEIVDIEVTFTPSEVLNEVVTATLTITSDDADEQTVEVVLSGAGVPIEIPVQQQIQDAIDFFETCTSPGGTIIGSAPNGKPKTAANRVKALRNMLKAAGRLYEIGETEIAIKQFQSIAKKTDGEESPPDFVTGDGVPELNQRVNDIINAMSP